MPPFDIPAFTRGISGGITGGLEGKREAEVRAEERRQRVIAEGISERQVAEREASGRARRERDAALAEERKLKREELEAGQRQRADFILNQLGAEDLEGISGFENQTLADQLKSLETALRRQRTKADRVGRKPPPTPAEERSDAILKRAGVLERGEMAGFPMNEIMSRATLEVDQQQSFLEDEPGFQGAFTGLAAGAIGGLGERLSGEEAPLSDADMSQARSMLQAKGVTGDAARRELQSAGFTEEEITRILGG